MDFTHTEERRLINESLARFLREKYSIDDRQTAIDSDCGYSESAWQGLGEMGVIAALVSPDHGGFGGSGHDLSLVFEALGRALCVEPWLATGVLSSQLLVAGGDPLSLLPGILTGERVVALAHTEPESGYCLSHVTAVASPIQSGWQITGHKAVVLHAENASHLLVSARTDNSHVESSVDDAASEHGISLFAVDKKSAGVTLRGYTTIDGIRAAEVMLDKVAVSASQLVGQPNEAFLLIEKAVAAGALAVCAEALGAMEQALTMTLDYLRTREQFGQPIGRFQALQHRMVDVATAIEQSRSLVIKAASVFDDTRQEREKAVSASKHYVGVAARLVAEESTQMHGGMGLASDTPISQYVKRLIMIDHLFGDTDYHLQRYIALTRQ